MDAKLSQMISIIDFSVFGVELIFHLSLPAPCPPSIPLTHCFSSLSSNLTTSNSIRLSIITSTKSIVAFCWPTFDLVHF
ncbi:hypothetical protein L6452_18097 [Arctium lappa]|uniref:Uncharacterized protein n=1 Tax=Arctium lappa TaxID=4217 RepID=A0ACB9C560_ARCLA|nr:hypothetical protein L6452_18097 [Arctium lappa]